MTWHDSYIPANSETLSSRQSIEDGQPRPRRGVPTESWSLSDIILGNQYKSSLSLFRVLR
jgi:hypothetical protein